MIPLEITEMFHPLHKLALGYGVLPGAYQAAVNQGISREHYGLDARQWLIWWLLLRTVLHSGIVLQPFP